MTKEETIKIMAMLNAFYSGGKGDPKMQATAWHLILAKYDYQIATEAVLAFAENDVRAYATFPGVGVIVAEINKAMARKKASVSAVLRGVSYGDRYEDLPDASKQLISEDEYNQWLKVDAEEFSRDMKKFESVLKSNRGMLTGVNYGQD